MGSFHVTPAYAVPRLLRDRGEREAAMAKIVLLEEMNPPPGTRDHEYLAFLRVLVGYYDVNHLRAFDRNPL